MRMSNTAIVGDDVRRLYNPSVGFVQIELESPYVVSYNCTFPKLNE